jgi:hypothetical protein
LWRSVLGNFGSKLVSLQNSDFRGWKGLDFSMENLFILLEKFRVREWCRLLILWPLICNTYIIRVFLEKKHTYNKSLTI